MTFLLIIVLLISSTVNAQSEKSNSSTKYDIYLEQYLKNRNVPSISAGILSYDSIIYTGYYGFTDLENSTKATKNSLYRIASISKIVTAVAVMQLVEKGKINLDADIRKYLPEFPKKKYKITTRSILNHTSGIRTYRKEEFHSKTFYPDSKTVLKLIENDSLQFKPGTKYLYTSLSYSLLAALVEKVSGMSFENYIKKRIFEPAGMISTQIDKQILIIPGRVKGYEKNERGEFINAPLADLSIKIPGGGLLSNVKDLLFFARSLLNETLISKATLDTMIAPTKLLDGTIQYYGLGVSISNPDEDYFYFGHSGNGTGFTSQLMIFPQEDFATVHLINLTEKYPGNPSYDLLKLFLGEEDLIPKRSFTDDLAKIYYKSGIDSTINFLKSIIIAENELYSFEQDEMKIFGYELLSLKKNVDAIYYFRFLANEFPESIMPLIGLGDAYHKDNNKGLAIKNFREVLKLDSQNKYAKDMIKKLSAN